MSGTPAGEVANAGQLGLATTLGATFMMGEMAQMGVMSASTAGMAGLAIGGFAAASYPFVQGYMRANDQTAAGVAEAAKMRPGGRIQDIGFFGNMTNNLTSFGAVLRGTESWGEFLNQDTETWKATETALNAANIGAGRAFFYNSPEDTDRYNRNKELDRTGAPMNEEDRQFMARFERNALAGVTPEGKAGIAEAHRQAAQALPQSEWFMGLKSEVLNAEGYFKEVSPESAMRAGYQLESAGVRDYERALGLARKYDAGVDPNLARQIMMSSGLQANQTNYARAQEMLPSTEMSSLNLQMGASFCWQSLSGV